MEIIALYLSWIISFFLSCSPYFCKVLQKVNYRAEIQRFVTGQYVFAAVRIAVAILLPAAVFAYFGVLKEYFLFPLGTSFVGLTDMPGPYHRRRNALIMAVISFVCTAAVASLLKDYEILRFTEIIFFGLFFSLIAVYGQRFAAVGGLTLVVLAVFLDGHLAHGDILKNLLIFATGCAWFVLVFIFVTKLQPYKLASQLIGENFTELADYLKIKSKFYLPDADYSALYREVIAKQVVIKNLQEETREVVFKTRQIVNESTTTSRLLMLMFLNSIDLFEKLLTADQDYQKLHEQFEHSKILEEIHEHLNLLSDEIKNIGIALQTGSKAVPAFAFREELNELNNDYFDLRNRKMNASNLEHFMSLRLILSRITEFSDDIQTIYKVFTQDHKLAKSLSTGLDYEKFLPAQEQLNLRVLFTNISLKSAQFRHAVRITLALLLGYVVSQITVFEIGRSYWILITIVAIMRPAFSTTKHRNLLRLYGTIAGAVLAYLILHYVHSDALLLGILFSSMILCFTFLKNQYAYAVFFMTLYVFITFNFLNPGDINQLFKDRILDTAIAGAIAFLVSYFVLPVWERTQNTGLMQKSSNSNHHYFKEVIRKLKNHQDSDEYKLVRKSAIINLANLSDNFQRMLSDPKNQQKQMERVHQFVNTSHLATAYTASLSQYANPHHEFTEIDLDTWNQKISAEFELIQLLLQNKSQNINDLQALSKLQPVDHVDQLLHRRKNELNEQEFFDRRDPHSITHLTEIKNIHEILELLFDVVHEQRKVVEKYAALHYAKGA